MRGHRAGASTAAALVALVAFVPCPPLEVTAGSLRGRVG